MDALWHPLSRHKASSCRVAQDGEVFKKGKIYIARSDFHLAKARTMPVTKGARENRCRPSIDPLFRSAAVAHGPGVVGVVLRAMLYDGPAGLIAIKKCGGVTVVQDPHHASIPKCRKTPSIT